MRFGLLSALMALALAGLGVASCTQDFDQFEPRGGSGGNGGSAACPTGEKSCNGVCVSADDPAFGCGDSCAPCSVANATTACVSGACAVGTCNPGFSDCDGMGATGCEVNTAADTQNCGACGTACTTFETCNDGSCEANPCGPGTADCNMNNADGCETMLGTLLDCNFCGDVCDLANASEACTMGMCALSACDAGFDDCDMMDATGCEVNVQTDLQNCGSCGNVCPGGALATCTNGMCGLDCAAGTGDCNNDPTDGCETDTSTSVDHCGACGRACSGANVASKSCAGGVCDSTCDIGHANCTRPAMGADNGCELDVEDNDTNCGGCGNDCSGGLDCDRGPDAQKVCGCTSNQECGGGGSTSCNAGTGLCSCGGTVCAAGELCGMGACRCNGGAACPAGNLCCQNPAGCVDPATDVNNCGACGRACPTGFTCAGAVCRCDGDDDCNAGSAGTCEGNGQCTCGGTQCGAGERCLPNGMCG
ncbi:hypothetical protein [Polyangium spumosum]|nr:hypothetical protein [Polyangium spumosum]